MVDIDDELFEKVLKEQREKEGRNPQRDKYRTRVEQAYKVLVENARDEDTTRINMVQQEARKFDNLIVHTWPDRRLVNKADPAVVRQLRGMRKAVSPESFVNSSGVAESQSPLDLR